MKSLWPTKKLGEICKIKTGEKDVDEGNPNGIYPFFTCSREITYSDSYSFDTEAILIAGNGDVGNTKIYKGKFEAYQRTYVLDGFKDNIKYIYYYLIENLKNILVKSKSGSTMPYIRKGDLENLQLPLPSLSIQQKIVKILDTIQEAIEIQEKIIEKTKELKKSLMAELFKYGGPFFRKGKRLKKTEIGEIPKDWEVVRLGDADLFKIKGGKRLPKGHNFADNKTPYNYIRVVDFKNGTVDVSNLKYLTLEDYKILKNYFITKDDIYISIAGTIGLVGLIPDELNGAILTENAAKIIIKNSDLVDKRFLAIFLSSFWGQNQIKALTSKSTQPKLGLYRIEQIKIPLPPFPKQQEVVEILQTIKSKN
jgi:type I restriction enzyme S subunit